MSRAVGNIKIDPNLIYYPVVCLNNVRDNYEPTEYQLLLWFQWHKTLTKNQKQNKSNFAAYSHLKAFF